MEYAEILKVKEVALMANSLLFEVTISGVMFRKLQTIILSWSRLLSLGQKVCQPCIESMDGLQ
jgi:hypothetical protein